MQLPFGQSNSIIGLDIGSASVKAVELTAKTKGIELQHVGIAQLPPEAIVQGAFLNSSAIVEAIREAVLDKNWYWLIPIFCGTSDK